ncbi:Type I secretion membrane fusion protein, HlyD, partial [Pseudomonas syringae pv. actinidiae ICMP 19096]
MNSPLDTHYAVPGKERGVQFFVRAGWILMLAGAGSFFLWASLAPLDQ